tara:strand:+ start:560 stop:1072 length:513 start_codon:yes stop_codon:yes gene_type:complete
MSVFECKFRSVFLICGVVVALGLSASEIRAAMIEPPNPLDLTQGKWELQPEKSRYCGPAPQSSSRVIFDAGWGLISTIWSGVGADGNPTANRYVARYDGEKYPAGINSPANEAITWTLVNPHRLEFIHWSKDDKITSEYVRIVSEDGQTMTQNAKFVGKACEESQVFERR